MSSIKLLHFNKVGRGYGATAQPQMGPERNDKKGTCSSPPPPGKREAISMGGEEGPHHSGKKVTYNCGEIYRYISGSKRFKCTRQGVWQQLNDDLICQGRACILFYSPQSLKQ